jgi:hypothetical protein
MDILRNCQPKLDIPIAFEEPARIRIANCPQQTGTLTATANVSRFITLANPGTEEF